MMDGKTTRKDRERQERSDLFLDIARDLISRKGFHDLSMNGIAEVAEFSKGTIYLHFASREMVLMALCLRGTQIWDHLTERAAQHNGPWVDRLIACHLAHQVYAALHPVEYEAIFLVDASSIREKITSEAHGDLDAAITAIFARSVGIIDGAVADRVVSLPDNLSSQDLAQGLWSLFAKPILRRATADAVSGACAPLGQDIRIGMLRAILVGLGWRGVEVQEDFQDRAIRVRDHVFGPEMEQLRKMGWANDCS